MRTIRCIMCLVLLTSAAAGQQARVVYDPSTTSEIQLSIWKSRQGDSTAWARPDYNDSGWTLVNSFRPSLARTGPGWLRSDVVIHKAPPPAERFVLRCFYLRSAYEIFWDGHLLYRSPDSSSDSTDGAPPHSFVYSSIPSEWTGPGEHSIAIRYTDFFTTAGHQVFRVWLSSSPLYHTNRIAWIVSQAFILGVILTAFLIGLGLAWKGNRDKALVLFVALCVNILAWRGAMFAYEFYNSSVSWLPFLFSFELISYFSVDVLLLAFFLVYFDLPYKVPNLAGAIIFNAVYIAIYLLDNALYYGVIRDMYSIFYFYVLGLLVYAARKKSVGSIHILVGFVCYSMISLPVLIRFLRNNIFEIAGFTIMILSIVFSINRRIKEEQKQKYALELRARRLEIELLKKSIQPHFILNTLASIKSWMSLDVRIAGRLIEAVAKEFRILDGISALKEISLQREVELCESHLEIMGYRKEARYRLVHGAINPMHRIPPLVLHTLVENGITHAFVPKEDGTFWLSVEAAADAVVYRIANNGSRLNGKAPAEHREGTGYRYVKARLEESYEGRWTMDYGMREGTWVVEITIRAED